MGPPSLWSTGVFLLPFLIVLGYVGSLVIRTVIKLFLPIQNKHLLSGISALISNLFLLYGFLLIGVIVSELKYVFLYLLVAVTLPVFILLEYSTFSIKVSKAKKSL